MDIIVFVQDAADLWIQKMAILISAPIVVKNLIGINNYIFKGSENWKAKDERGRCEASAFLC